MISASAATATLFAFLKQEAGSRNSPWLSLGLASGLLRYIVVDSQQAGRMFLTLFRAIHLSDTIRCNGRSLHACA